MGQFAPLNQPLRVRAGKKIILVDTPEMAVIAAQQAGNDGPLAIHWMDIEMQLLEAIKSDDPLSLALAMLHFADAARESGRVV